jgi:DNA-binding CsgD family transcriptional regulator
MMLDAAQSRVEVITNARRVLGDGLPASLDLRQLWDGLLAGRLLLLDAHYAGERALATIVQVERTSAGGISPEDAWIVGRALRGERPKSLAWELGVVPSRIATRCTNVLVAIGQQRQLPHTSIVLVAAAHAASGLPVGRARVDGASVDGNGHWVVSIDNPAQSLREHLSPSEYEVARLAVEGKTYAAIALARQTSARTVANQLASTFRKLRVSGRCELRARAVRDHALSREAPPPPHR